MTVMADDVQVKMCLQEIVKLEMNINAVIQDIRDCQGPLEELQDFNQTAREHINELKNRFEELDNLANEQDKETDRLTILRDLDVHRKQLASTQAVLRRANLTCQLYIEKKDRESLLSGQPTKVRKRGSSDKEQLAKTSSNITKDLMSITRTMSEQVLRGEMTMNTLVTSSQQVTETQEEFKSMSGHITNSRKLLTKFGRREFTDKLLIFTAMLFFLASAAYIFKKRFLDRIWT